MKVSTIKALITDAVSIDSSVEINGWLRTRRDSRGGFSFLSVYDGSCFNPIQVVANDTLANYTSEILHLTTGCSLRVSGRLVESQGKGQRVEIEADNIEVVGWVDEPEAYPIAKKRHTFEYLREVAHLRPRTNAFGAISRVRGTLSHAIHHYFHQRGYLWVNTPIITASDAEGAGEMFRVSTLDLVNRDNRTYEQDFFGKEAFLTVSGQLNAEAYALALTRVYTFGPTFRAENSNTSRHLAEFWMIEPEVAFADLDDLAVLAEDFLRYLFKAVLDEREDDIAFFAERVDRNALTRLQQLVDADFEHMEYGEAIRLLQDAPRKFEFPVEWGLDLQSEHERYLAEEHVGRPIVLRNYPRDIKAFYMRANEDEKTVAAMDVLAPGIGEIIGGSQREERLDFLDRRLEEMGRPASLEWYRDLRRYGTTPHSGFGLGFERLINYVTGMENIRDAIPFPRTPRNAEF